MNPPARRRRLLLAAPAVAFSVGILFLSSRPGSQVPSPGIAFGDKLDDDPAVDPTVRSIVRNGSSLTAADAFAGFDQLATLALLRDLATRRQLAVCAVLHDLNLASAFASRIVALADGRIVRDGTPLEVLDADLVQSMFGAGLEVVARDGRPTVVPRVPVG